MRASPKWACSHASSRIESPADEPRNKALDIGGEIPMWFSLWAKTRVLAALGVFSWLALASSVEAKPLRFAFQGELKTVDPYQINESFSLTVNASVYEGLIRRGPDLKIQPCLATSWEILDPLHWRFHLRKGVKFHEGQDFTADDVIFSVHRVVSAG